MMGRQGSQDNTDQLMRDLQDASEREQDLKDQLKFAEEEVSPSIFSWLPSVWLFTYVYLFQSVSMISSKIIVMQSILSIIIKKNKNKL